MSQDDVEVVQAIYEAYARADYDAVFDHYHDDIEWSEPPDSPASATYRGHDGVRASLRQWAGTWGATHRSEPQELMDMGEHVLVRVREVGKGRTSGVEVSEEQFHVWTLRGGKVGRMQMFRHRGEALEALGLPE